MSTASVCLAAILFAAAEFLVCHGAPSPALAFVLLAATLTFTWVGARVELQRKETEPNTGHSLLAGALLSLLGLLLAFTLSASAGRLDNRRMASINEANAIGTASLRLSLLPDAPRQELKTLYIEYIENRLMFNGLLSREDRYDYEESHSDDPTAVRPLSAIQADIWKQVVASVDADSRLLVIPAVNESFDASSTRETLTRAFTPTPILFFLTALTMLCAFLVGEATARSGGNVWLYRILFATAISAAIFIVVDLDNPRTGLIRISQVDALLSSTEKSLKATP